MSEPSVYATKAFWTGLMERTIKVAGAAGLGAIGTTAVGLAEVDWAMVGSATLLASVVNILVCFAQPQFVAGVQNSHGNELIGEQIEYMETKTKYAVSPNTVTERYAPPADDHDHELDPNGLASRQ